MGEQPTAEIKLSLVVCTHNRAELLRDCLEALANQTCDARLYEVLVVNNNSTDGTEEICSTYAARHANFRALTETTPGVSRARNLGCREARADWVAYIDDDARTFPDYVERAIRITEKLDFECFGGRVVPDYPPNKPDWYLDRYCACDPPISGVGPLTRRTDFVIGCNCVFRKDVLERLGGFNERMGMKGNELAYGEEVLLQALIRRDNGTIGFDSDLGVRHTIFPEQMTFRWMFRSFFANGASYWDCFRQRPTWLKLLLNVMVIPVWLLVSLVMHTPRLVRRSYRIQNWVFDVFVIWMLSVGALVGGVRKKLQPARKA